MISRRNMLVGLGSVMTMPLLACSSNDHREQMAYADQAAADRWMSEWIRQSKVHGLEGEQAPDGGLYLGRFADPVYFLREPIGWKPNPDQAGAYSAVQVPVGFVTDFASIPREFWSVLRPDGLYAYAAIIHDYLYWQQSLPRETCDAILKMCMQDFKIDAVTVASIYSGVRVGGGFAWRGNARLKQNGEQRVLVRFPDDPTVRWAQWKKRPDVFKQA